MMYNSIKNPQKSKNLMIVIVVQNSKTPHNKVAGSLTIRLGLR